jgi:Hint domain
MSEQINTLASWQRTRRSVLAMGGVLAGATLSCIKRAAAAGKGHENDGAACYLAGTHILTVLGERRIEDLAVGDLVVTVDGGVKPIQWIGQRRYRRPANAPWDDVVKPVRIARGALKRGVPHADLHLSQEHRLLLDGGLVRSADLVNGTSIALDPCTDRSEIEYRHIKLAVHDVIFAEGAAAETLLFNPCSIEAIDNMFDYQRMYGRADVGERACAPVYSDCASGRRGQLMSHLRSAVSPWFDRRKPIDRIRDQLWDRADALAAGATA